MIYYKKLYYFKHFYIHDNNIHKVKSNHMLKYIAKQKLYKSR